MHAPPPAIITHQIADLSLNIHLSANKGRLEGKREVQDPGITKHIHRTTILNHPFDLIKDIEPMSTNPLPNEGAIVRCLDQESLALIPIVSPNHLAPKTT